MITLKKLNISFFAAITLCFAACSSDGTISRSDSYEAQIYPDYKDVTIPCNIAPLNFSVTDSSATDYALLIESGDSSIWVNADGKDFNIDKSDWKDMLSNIASNSKTTDAGKIKFTIARKEGSEWVGGKPFNMTVVPDSIDDFLTYRLVPPGYEGWYRMGIYQQQLSTSEEEAIFDNSHLNGACMNCHTVGSQRADRTLFHVRSYYGGTYLNHDGIVERLEAKTDSTIGAFVYPSWHPNGKLIAFSVNKTVQTFHTSNKNRIEVYDHASDLIVYDIDKHEIFSTPIIKQEHQWETYPNFSPDGKWIYFCSANEVDSVTLNHAKVKYSLCRIAFDTEKQQFGNEIETVLSYNAPEIMPENANDSTKRAGKSISFPRISPDGNFLVCTIHNHGNFSIWHKDADLYLIDLRDIDNKTNIKNLNIINSDETESYHSWSSNSRWLVFSSRRDDGLYTRPYFTYIDKDGNPHKPFMLPQDNPRKHYTELDCSYNIPEFMTSTAITSMRSLLDVAYKDSIQVTYRK